MDRVTYYDVGAGCYKLKPESGVNHVQLLGRLERMTENIESAVKARENHEMTSDVAWVMIKQELEIVE